jgi:spore coat protein CotH
LTLAWAGGFYDAGQVNEVRLTFVEQNWDEILDSLYAAGEEGRLIGTAAINGVRFDSVGVRYKGYSSYNPSRKKNPFNIELDEVKAGQNVEGHGTVRLANVYKDPSFVREALSYEIARKYMPAGRASFADVYVNDTLIGLYTNDEDPDKLFMRTNFLCDENARFKGRIQFDSVEMTGWKYLGADSTPYLDYFEMESASGWDELIGLFDTLSNHNDALDRVLNVDRHLWMLAFDVLLVNLDAPINTAQNYYLYRDASARFNPIVWDLNESFGAFRDLEGTGQLTLAQMQQLDPFLRASDPDYPIASQVFNDARRRRMYVAHMKTMISEVFSGEWYEDRAYEIQDIIDAHVQADQNKFYTHNDFLNNVTRSVGSGPLAIVGLTELMKTRATFLLAQPEFLATAPSVTDVRHHPERGLPDSDVLFVAEVGDADSAFLGFRQNPAFRFTRAVMYDDGTHGDSLSGDGRFTAKMRVGAGNIEYYVYAENTDAGTFYPARAEHEFLTLPVAGSVVVNELMADNVRTARDPNGQYDDWIELYNNDTSSFDLDGCLLTDDSSHLMKWLFPDTSLVAGGYLIVWADEDTGQVGLHANFSLRKSGGTLVFSDADGYPMDRVVFGPQSADISFGRYPNGVGLFMLMDPTFGAANDSGVGVAESPETSVARLSARAFPNPFLRSTAISYTMAHSGKVTVRVFDSAGRLAVTLFNGEQAAGRHVVSFSLPSGATSCGVYFARLAVAAADGAGSFESVKLVRAR